MSRWTTIRRRPGSRMILRFQVRPTRRSQSQRVWRARVRVGKRRFLPRSYSGEHEGIRDMNNTKSKKNNSGFSLMELMLAMTIMLVLMGLVSMLLSKAFSVRARESQRTDALTSAQAALNVLSREIANSGFGIYAGTNSQRASNGIVTADSDAHRIHIRSNVDNVGPTTALADCVNW